MLSTSANFTSKFMSSDRTLNSYVVINGTTYSSDSVVNWEFHDSISVSDTFEIGTTVANTFDLTLQNVSGSFDNATVTPYVGIDTTGSGSYEYVPLGVFTVDNVETMNISSTSKNITLHCFDSMLKLDVPFVWSGGDTDTISNVMNQISTLSGVSLGNNTTTTTGNFYEETDPFITYSSSWTDGVGYKFTSSLGANLTFTFTGTGFEFYSYVGTTRGIAQITIDNGSPINVDLYNASAIRNQLVYQNLTLPDTSHTVKISCTGTKNTNSSNTLIYIDKIKAYQTTRSVSYPTTLINKVDDIYSCREMLSFISSLMGGVGVIDRSGKINIKTFTNPSSTVLTITGDHYSDNFNKGTDTYSIARVTGYDENGDSFSSGTLSLTNMEIKFFNPFINQTLIDSIGAKLNGITYIPFNMDWIGNPAIESGDNIAIDEYGVSVFNTVLLNSVMTYPAFGMTSETKTEGKSTNSSNDFEVIPKQVQNYVDLGLFTKEDAIHKGTTPQSNPVIDSIWIDTTTIPNAIKRWDGSQWVKVTPIVPEDIGATTKAYVDQQISTVSSGGGTNIAIGSTAPTSPPVDKLWIDTSVTPPVMKKWDGSVWQVLDRSSFSELTGTISASQISANTITGGMIVAGTIGAGQIAVGTLTGNLLVANTITGDKIATNTIDATNIKAGTITANEIKAGTITTNLIDVNGLSAGVIKTGTLSGDRISGGTIVGITITGGSFETSAFNGFKSKLSLDNLNFSNGTSSATIQYVSGLGLNFTATGNNFIFGSGAISCSSVSASSSMTINGSSVLTSSALSGYATQSWVTSQGYVTSGSSPSFSGLNMSAGANIGGNWTTSGSITFGGSVTANNNINSSGYGGTGTHTYVGTNNEVRITDTLFGGGGPNYRPLRAGNIYQNGVQVTSSQTQKKNITDYTNDALQELMTTPVRFYQLLEDLDEEKPRVGIILEESPADIVFNMDGIDLYGYVGLCHKAIQQLKAEIDILKSS